MDTKFFKTGDGKKVSMQQVYRLIADYIKVDTSAEYEIGVGTDSQNHAQTKIVEIISVRRIGRGGIFFYRTELMPRIQRLKDKIYEETSRSIENANGLIDEIELILLEDDIDIDKLKIDFSIHCDVGYYGKTKTLIDEIVGWVHSLDYEVKIKPDSYIASGIADKFSK